MNDEEELETGLDVLRETVGDMAEEDDESEGGPLTAAVEQSLAGATPTRVERPVREMLMRELEEARNRLVAKPAAPSSPLDRLIERFGGPTGKSGNLMVARRERAAEQAKKDEERRADLLALLSKQEQLESADINEQRRIDAARAKAMQGPQDTAYMRNLKYRADLLGITTEELLRREQDPSGLNLKPSEIRSIRLEVASTLNGPKERLNLINEGLNNLRLAAQGNPQAEAQLNRSLASISGDKQLSLAEVETVVGAGSFAQRVTNAISKFFTGGAGDLTNEQKKELLETYEAYHAKRYNDSRNRLKNIYSSAGLTNLPEDMFDSPYISSAERRKKKQEEDAKAKENESTESSGSITLSGGKTVRPIGQ
jgi:hypothetical protein